MILTKEQIDGLMRLIGLTEDEEIDCGQCLTLIAEFAEKNLIGEPLPAGLEVVSQHLAICNECREEYELLQKALQRMDLD